LEATCCEESLEIIERLYGNQGGDSQVLTNMDPKKIQRLKRQKIIYQALDNKAWRLTKLGSVLATLIHSSREVLNNNRKPF